MDENEIKKHNQKWYQKTYNALVNKAKSRGLDKKTLDGYYEKHHILPKCLGGTNEKSNLVLFTAREHLIAHMLLHRIYPDNIKILNAVIAMFTGPKNGLDKEKFKSLFSSRSSSYYRKLYSEAKKGKPGHKHTEITKKKISAANLGRKFTKEQSLEHSVRMKNRIFTDKWRNNISKGMTGKKHPHKKPNLSEETRKRKADLCKSRSGAKHPNSKKIIDPNGNIFSSITECAKNHNMTRENLSYIIHHNPSKGFKLL